MFCALNGATRTPRLAKARHNPATISEEGARNLLLPEGYAVDLDADGIHEVGLAKTASFPPANAPAEFREAWFQASAGIDDGLRMGYALIMHGAMYGWTLAESSPTARVPDNDPASAAVENTGSDNMNIANITFIVISFFIGSFISFIIRLFI